MNGKIISVSSVKGGVGKTTILLNLAGIYCELGKRVLIIDMDLFSGGIAISLDIKNTKDIFMLVDSMAIIDLRNLVSMLLLIILILMY